MSKMKFYKPLASKERMAAFGFDPDTMVYREYRFCKADFPEDGVEIVELSHDEEMLKIVVDDDDQRTPDWKVGIPVFGQTAMREVYSGKTREGAIKYAQEVFGADENGMIGLISNIS